MQSAAGDEVLLDKEYTTLLSRTLLSPCWMDPFKVPARTAPNTYHLGVPVTWRTCAQFNVKRLRPYLRRPDHRGGAAAPPPPWSARRPAGA